MCSILPWTINIFSLIQEHNTDRVNIRIIFHSAQIWDLRSFQQFPVKFCTGLPSAEVHTLERSKICIVYPVSISAKVHALTDPNSVEVHNLQRSTICTGPHFTQVHSLLHRSTHITRQYSAHVWNTQCLHSAQVPKMQKSPLCPHIHSAHVPTLHIPILNRSPICTSPRSAPVPTLNRSPLSIGAHSAQVSTLHRSALCRCPNSAQVHTLHRSTL